jgi:hypothetical protein
MKMLTGFSKLETLLTCGFVGLLALLMIPRYAGAAETSNTQQAHDELIRISGALKQFRAVNGYYPPNISVGKLPPEMRTRIKDMFDGRDPFRGLTPIGGQYDYEYAEDGGPISMNIVGSAIIEPPSAEDAMKLDAMIDDGDLLSGNFRVIDNGFAFAFDRE